METKLCLTCKEYREIDQFAKKRNALSSKCKPCQREYAKKHYQSNKLAYYAKINRYKQKLQLFVQEYKSSHPCNDCNQFYHFSVMDFDHLGDKKFNISPAKQHGFPSILEELKKCELVCSNCHRLRTWNRLQSPQ